MSPVLLVFSAVVPLLLASMETSFLAGFPGGTQFPPPGFSPCVPIYDAIGHSVAVSQSVFKVPSTLFTFLPGQGAARAYCDERIVKLCIHNQRRRSGQVLNHQHCKNLAFKQALRPENSIGIGPHLVHGTSVADSLRASATRAVAPQQPSRTAVGATKLIPIAAIAKSGAKLSTEKPEDFNETEEIVYRLSGPVSPISRLYDREGAEGREPAALERPEKETEEDCREKTQENVSPWSIVSQTYEGKELSSRGLWCECGSLDHTSHMKLQEYLRTFSSASNVGDHSTHHAGRYSITTSDNENDTREQAPADRDEPPVTHRHGPGKRSKDSGASTN
ncbi:hypothetical protein FBULB1_14186 [Fusarium bulbicola]|nr:hypothetical protein FBULB1_14186 [Fusarium bulbicola]